MQTLKISPHEVDVSSLYSWLQKKENKPETKKIVLIKEDTEIFKKSRMNSKNWFQNKMQTKTEP